MLIIIIIIPVRTLTVVYEEQTDKFVRNKILFNSVNDNLLNV